MVNERISMINYVKISFFRCFKKTFAHKVGKRLISSKYILFIYKYDVYVSRICIMLVLILEHTDTQLFSTSCNISLSSGEKVL